ncbi:hypothetical protein D3C72_1729800 [compost metagenome]
MDQVVQPAEVLGARFKHAFAIVRHRYVQRVGVDPLSGGVELGRDLLQAGVVDVGQHQPRAMRGHEAGRGQTDAVARARDGGNLPFERNHPVS